MFKRLKQLKGQKGFTLIELMIVVAIIGILAAIAIPNFLQYQLKSRQSEAKTNLQGIKTSQVSFQAERGCYLGINAQGAAAPVAGTKSAPFTWGAGVNAVAANNFCVVGGVFVGEFNDIGFKPTGSVFFQYGVDANTVAAPGVYTTITSCALYPGATMTAAVAAITANNFVAVAKSNLDGDANISTWDSTVDHGANDCTIGSF